MKKYVQFSGWARIGAWLSGRVDAWHTYRLRTMNPTSGLERGLWLEHNDEE